jgi:hypothetical protein
LARILGFHLADQTLTTSHDCGRTLPEVESARMRQFAVHNSLIEPKMDNIIVIFIKYDADQRNVIF